MQDSCHRTTRQIHEPIYYLVVGKFIFKKMDYEVAEIKSLNFALLSAPVFGYSPPIHRDKYIGKPAIPWWKQPVSLSLCLPEINNSYDNANLIKASLYSGFAVATTRLLGLLTLGIIFVSLFNMLNTMRFRMAKFWTAETSLV